MLRVMLSLAGVVLGGLCLAFGIARQEPLVILLAYILLPLSTLNVGFGRRTPAAQPAFVAEPGLAGVPVRHEVIDARDQRGTPSAAA